MSEKTIETVLAEHQDRIMALPGIVGISIGRYKNKPCIMVFVVRKTKQLIAQIPVTLDKYPVVVQETGEFRALDHT
jgi:hypothetical protein